MKVSKRSPHNRRNHHLRFLSPLGERLGEGVVGRDDYDTNRARDLRRDGSRAERKVWELLRARRISGAKFRRQYPIGPYFADFACLSRNLVIEVDGDHHAFQVEADASRTAVMEREGWLRAASRIFRSNSARRCASSSGLTWNIGSFGSRNSASISRM